MKCPPKVGIIHSSASAHLTWRIALCEWIDNSLDAGASSVSITFGRHEGVGFVRVEDDGCGRADLQPFFTLGDHVEHKSTRSGRYGIGSKDAALWIGGVGSRFFVESTHGGRVRSTHVDWRRLADDWEIPDPSEWNAPPERRSGTMIRVEPLARVVPHGQAWDELLAEIAYTYTPALVAGKQIKFRQKANAEPQLLVPWAPADLEPDTVVEATVDVGGKRAFVRAGLVKLGAVNRRPGLTYWHGFRVLMSGVAHGCGEAPVARISGSVRIDDGWTRNRNKDGIQNPEPLYEAVESALQPLLAKATTQGALLTTSRFVTEVEAQINAALADPNDSKAKRDRGTSKGTNVPTGTGRKHRDAAKKQPGATMPGGRGGSGVRVEYGNYGARAGVGHMTSGRVCLNLDNPAVASAKDKNVAATVGLIAGIVAAYHAFAPVGQTPPLRGLSTNDNGDTLEKFCAIFARLASFSALDGVAAVPALPAMTAPEAQA